MGIISETSLASAGDQVTTLKRDYYGCYCLKFTAKTGIDITERMVEDDFKVYGEVVDVRGPGLFSGLRGNFVYVRLLNRPDAEEALKHLGNKYQGLMPATSDEVLPDNYGLYTVSFYNKTGISSAEIKKRFSLFGEVKNLTGCLDTKGGRVFVGFKEKLSAVTAIQSFFSKKDIYPNMKFALPKCEKDYFGCYCLKFYNKNSDSVETVLKDFTHFGEVVDIRGPGIFETPGDDVYVRFKDKSSAEKALIVLMEKYDSLCFAPPSDIQADKFGFFTITFVNEKRLSKSDIWFIFSKFGTVVSVNGIFNCVKGRIFVSFKEKQGALKALETTMTTKEYHLQVSRNSVIRKNEYYGITSSKDTTSTSEKDSNDEPLPCPVDDSSILSPVGQNRNIHKFDGGKNSSKKPRAPVPCQKAKRGKENHPASLDSLKSGPSGILPAGSRDSNFQAVDTIVPISPVVPESHPAKPNWFTKFNRNVEMDIFGCFCLSFLNDDGNVTEQKVRGSFGKFGEVVSVRGALGKQKGHVFVRFREKEAAENCLNCFNSFPLSEMSELFGKYLYLSPATPRDIDYDVYGLYNISFINLHAISVDEISLAFSRFGYIAHITLSGYMNVEVIISYTEKNSAIEALRAHFTNADFPYLDIAKGHSVLSFDVKDSSSNDEEKELNFYYPEPQPIRRDLIHDCTNEDFPYLDIEKGHSVLSFDVKDSSSNEEEKAHRSPIKVSQHEPIARDPSHVFKNEAFLYLDNVGGHSVSSFYEKDASSNGEEKEINSCHPGPIEVAEPEALTKDPFHDSFLSKNGHANIADELLKPFESYYNIYRTGKFVDQISEDIPVKNEITHEKALVQPKFGNVDKLHPDEDSQASFSCVKRIQNSSSGNPISDIGLNFLPPGRTFSVDAVTEMPLTPKDITVNRIDEPDLPEDDLANVHRGLHLLEVNEKFSSETMEVSPPDISSNSSVSSKDVFGSYSLIVVGQTKNLSERIIKTDLGKCGEVVKVRGPFVTSSLNSTIDIFIVSFSLQESAQSALKNATLIRKYPFMRTAPPMKIVPDKSGHFNIEFENSAMISIKEISNLFARHGEVKEVSLARAKNGIRRIKVSFLEKDSALEAIRCHEKSRDFEAIDFSKECLELKDTNFEAFIPLS